MKILEMAHAQLCKSVQLNWPSERTPVPLFWLPMAERPSRGKKWQSWRCRDYLTHGWDDVVTSYVVSFLHVCCYLGRLTCFKCSMVLWTPFLTWWLLDQARTNSENPWKISDQLSSNVKLHRAQGLPTQPYSTYTARQLWVICRRTQRPTAAKDCFTKSICLSWQVINFWCSSGMGRFLQFSMESHLDHLEVSSTWDKLAGTAARCQPAKQRGLRGHTAKSCWVMCCYCWVKI